MAEIVHLAYHYLTLPSEEPAGPQCSLSRFQEQLDALKDGGYAVLSCGEIVYRLKTRLSFPEKCVTLSFDDNLRDGYTKAYPLLRRYGFPGTFFVITTTLDGRIPPVIKIQMLAGELGGLELQRVLAEKFRGSAYESLMDPKQYDMAGKKMGEPNPDNRRPFWVFCHILPLSLQVDLAEEMFDEVFGVSTESVWHKKMFIQPNELREMSQNGMEVSSHTENHPLLSTCGIGDAEKEAIQSRIRLHELFGEQPTIEIFGWPFGGVFKPSVVKTVAKYYDGAFNYLNGDHNDLYNLPRLNGVDAEL